ncbi:MAG: hypothetical protein AAB885_02050 [Patescibacteria group bacterium]
MSKVISICLAVGSLVVAGLIIFDNPISVTQKSLSFEIQNSETINSISQLLITESNSTEEIAKKLTEDIIAKNPNGPETGNDGGLLSLSNPDKIISEMLADSLSKFDYDSLKPDISDKEMIILSADDEKSRTSYLESLNEIVSDELSSLPKQPEVDQFGAIAAAYDRAVKKLYNLPVPKSFSSIHKETVRLFFAQEKIFSYIADYQNDPLTALLSLQATDLVSEELAALNDKFNSLNQ